ncbi:MAG: hypothetical protein ACXW3Z_07040 [Limisphaerales bacterium]
MARTVNVYNLETNQMSTIPASELAPGMVEADVQGVGRVWIEASQAREFKGYRHGPFQEVLRNAIRTIKDALDEVYPRSFDDWEDGFRKDTNPEYEIALWLHIASTYEQLTDGTTTTFAERRDIFKVLVNCSISSKDTVFEVLKLDTISKEKARRVVDAYFQK